MSLKEKIANAQPSDWLKNGMTDEEVSQLVTEAKEDARERLSLEEAIKHCEEVAESKERQIKEGAWEKDSITEKRCYECAKEHRQLAEWLRELKMYREVIDNKSFEITDPLDPHRHHVLVVKVTDLYNDFFDF